MSSSFRGSYHRQQHYAAGVVLGEEALLSRMLRLNDLAIEQWIRHDLVGTEQNLAKALNCLHALCRTKLNATASRHDRKKPSSSSSRTSAAVKTAVAAPPPDHSGSQLTFLGITPVSVGVESSPPRTMDVFSRAFLFNTTGRTYNSWITMDDSLDVIAAVLFYNAALFYHLQPGEGEEEEGDAAHQRGGAVTTIKTNTLSNRDRYGFVVRYYEKADRLLSRYLECHRRPLWLLQAALWHNIGKCYQQRAICDCPHVASYVYLDQVKAIINWIEDPLDQAFFKCAGIDGAMQQLAQQERQCSSARAA
jgi:hypothetical protein